MELVRQELAISIDNILICKYFSPQPETAYGGFGP